MKTSFEIRIEHEDLIRAEAKRRFPDKDPQKFVDTWLNHMQSDARKTAQFVMLMTPEIIRATRIKETK